MAGSFPSIRRVIRSHPLSGRAGLGRVVMLGSLLVLAGAPLSAARGTPGSAVSAHPARIAFELLSKDFQRSEIDVANADGTGGIRQLIPGTHNSLGCESADGRKMLYRSDQEAPHEQFLYLANADGTNPEKVTESEVGFWCPFSEHRLILTKQNGAIVVRHDLQTGAEKTVLTNVDRWSVSPDGNKIVYVGGLDFTPVPGQRRPKGKETLDVLDLTTLKSRRLAGPLPITRSYFFDCNCVIPAWSPDSARVAYAVGPSKYKYTGSRRVDLAPRRAQPYTVYVRTVRRAAARVALRFSGGPPAISWSHDGRQLLVCSQDRGRSFAASEDDGCARSVARAKCSRKTGQCRYLKGYFRPEFAGTLTLVDLAHRSATRVASGKLIFAQWAPASSRYAYATTTAAWVARPDGSRRLLMPAPKPHWPDNDWLGWSPDERYIGLGDAVEGAGRLTVVNVKSGRTRVLARDTENEFIWGEAWWR